MKSQRQSFVYVVLALTVMAVAAPANEEAIETIRSRSIKIDRELKHCKRTEMDLAGYSTEGGSLTLYSFGSAPRKLIAHYYGEMGQANEEYYFWNNELFFVLRTVADYDKPFGQQIAGKTSRFYFDKGRLIRWIEGQYKQVYISKGKAVRRINGPNRQMPLTGLSARQRKQAVLADAKRLLATATRKASSP